MSKKTLQNPSEHVFQLQHLQHAASPYTQLHNTNHGYWRPLPPYSFQIATDPGPKLTLPSLLPADALSFSSQYTTTTKCIHASQMYQNIIEYPPVTAHPPSSANNKAISVQTVKKSLFKHWFASQLFRHCSDFSANQCLNSDFLLSKHCSSTFEKQWFFTVKTLK